VQWYQSSYLLTIRAEAIITMVVEVVIAVETVMGININVAASENTDRTRMQ